MRTSSKLLIAALLIFAGSLTFYNVQLKAEFLTGSYKEKYYNYNHYDFKDFDEIQVNAGNMVHVSIEPGDFRVLKSKYLEDTIKFTKFGKRLIIDVDYKVHPDTINTDNHYNHVVIFLPVMKYLKSDAFYTVNGKIATVENFTSDKDHSPSDNCQLQVSKFTLDSLKIEQNAAGIYLDKNVIKKLKVTNSKFSSAVLYIDRHNNIELGDFNIGGVSKLILNTQTIPQLKYNIGPTAQITVNGATLSVAKH